MFSRRTYITIFVVTSLLLTGCTSSPLIRGDVSPPVTHYDFLQALELNARVLDAMHGERLAKAQVFYTLTGHPGQWPDPLNMPLDLNLGESDFLGVVDLVLDQSYSADLTRGEFSEISNNLTFILTITKDGYVSRKFDLDTANFPRDDNYATIVDLGDVIMSRE